MVKLFEAKKESTYSDLTDELVSIFGKIKGFVRWGEDDDLLELMYETPERAKFAMRRLYGWTPYFKSVEFDPEDDRVILLEYRDDTPFKIGGTTITGCQNKKKKMKSKMYVDIEDNLHNAVSNLESATSAIEDTLDGLIKVAKPTGDTWEGVIEVAGGVSSLLNLDEPEIENKYGSDKVDAILDFIGYVSNNENNVMILYVYGDVTDDINKAIKVLNNIG